MRMEDKINYLGEVSSSCLPVSATQTDTNLLQRKALQLKLHASMTMLGHNPVLETHQRKRSTPDPPYLKGH